MNRHTNHDSLVRRHFDGESTESERRALMQELSRDERARTEIEGIEALHLLLAELAEEAPEPPAGLPERAAARAFGRRPPRVPWWRRLAESLTAGPVRLAAASASLVAVGLVAGLFLGPDGVEPGERADVVTKRARPPLEAPGQAHEDERVRVHFVLRAPEAGSVAVVGDFNGWDVYSDPLERAGDVWRAVMALPPGRYEYQFVVDGEIWLVDPSAPGKVDDGFGGQNGVLEV